MSRNILENFDLILIDTRKISYGGTREAATINLPRKQACDWGLDKMGKVSVSCFPIIRGFWIAPIGDNVEKPEKLYEIRHSSIHSNNASIQMYLPKRHLDAWGFTVGDRVRVFGILGFRGLLIEPFKEISEQHCSTLGLSKPPEA